MVNMLAFVTEEVSKYGSILGGVTCAIPGNYLLDLLADDRLDEPEWNPSGVTKFFFLRLQQQSKLRVH